VRFAFPCLAELRFRGDGRMDSLMRVIASDFSRIDSLMNI